MASELGRPPAGEPILTATGLVKSFGGFRVVDGLDLVVNRGEILALIGPNGAGKTTVFNLLSGGLRADEGRVSFCGRDVTGLAQHRISRLGIGRTFQDVRLWQGMSVQDNVAVYCQAERSLSLARAVLTPWAQWRAERAVAVEARQALDRFGLADLAGVRASEISYAQQKLVALARLLASRSQLLLLDEPASGLDEGERDAIVQAVRQLAAAGLTICVVEHNMDLVRAVADRVCFLAQGRLLAEGTPEKVFQESELAEIYFGAGR